jgi:Arc/MetJ family transcription regulator
MRTNIVIDESLIKEARRLTSLSTKKAIVEEALRTLIRVKNQERILSLRGKVRWEGDLSEMRGSRSHAGHR